MAEQLPLDFTASVSVRMRRAKKIKEEDERQPPIFTAPPNMDIHLHSPAEAVAHITSQDAERTINWLQALVGNVRVIKSKRVAFPTSSLDRLLDVRPPAQVTLDAATLAVARAIWAHKLGLKPLKITRESHRLLASSPRWPSGFRVKDAPWPTIATIQYLGIPVDIDPLAQNLMLKKMANSGTHIATAGLAGSAVIFEANQPALLENLGLPALAYSGEPGTGIYRMPLLSAESLLEQPAIKLSPDLEAAIKKATAPVKPLETSEGFPWTLYPFQARDGGKGRRILEVTGGVLLAGDMGSGKCLSVQQKVLTPHGAVPAGNVKEGDFLVGKDGKPTEVLATYTQGIQDMYRITFSDGSFAIADDDQKWAVHSAVMKKRGHPNKVLTTRELREGKLRDAAGNLRWYIPMCEPVEFEQVRTPPIAPYALGALLGDGGLTQDHYSFASIDEEIVQRLRDELGVTITLCPLTDEEKERRATERGCSPEEINDCSHRLVGTRDLRETLKELNLHGKYAWEKSVPAEYRYGSIETRRAVLQGLLDTDGGPCDQRSPSSIEFTSTSEQLADDVVWLVQSLGGTARKSAPVRKKYSYKGEKRTGRPAWRVSLQLPDHVTPFYCFRKVERYRSRVKYWPSRGIKSIEPAGRDDTICFTVAAEDHLFLLDSCLVGHNTTISLALVHEMDIWPLLVVAPLSAFSTWARQLEQMGRSFYLATEAPAKSWAKIEEGGLDAVVVSYDRLPAFLEVIERYGFKGIVADELQRIRTPTSRRSRAIRELAAHIPLRIGLSGTPLTNTVNDLLPLGAFLAPSEWKPRANTKDLEDLYPGDPIESIADHLGSIQVRRRMDDTGATLPKRNDHRVFIQLTPEQRRAIAEMEAEAEAAKEAGEFDEPGSKIHAFARLQRMRQIINCPSAAGVPGPNPKVTAALDLAQDFLDQGRKGVIFCADRTTFRELGKGLDARGIGWVGIWGSTPPEDRINNEKRFHNEPEIKVVVCTIQAGSESWSASPTGTWLISTAYVYAPSTLSQMECSLPGMLVSTEAGCAPIEEIETGDMVLTHEGRYRRVSGASKRDVKETVYHVEVAGATRSLSVTGNHPVLAQTLDSEGRPPAWMPARLLSEGDLVATLGKDGSRLLQPIRKITVEEYEGPVYNFSVEDDESYVLQGVVVHNCRVYRMSSDPNGPDIEICYIHAQAAGGSLDDRMVEIINIKKELFAQVVDRMVHTDNTKVHYTMGDLVYLMTGKRDEALDAREADQKAHVQREIDMKEHAKKTLYAKKGKNKTSAESFLDQGDQAKTLEEMYASGDLKTFDDMDLDEAVELPAHLKAAFEDDPEDDTDDFDMEDGDDA